MSLIEKHWAPARHVHGVNADSQDKMDPDDLEYISRPDNYQLSSIQTMRLRPTTAACVDSAHRQTQTDRDLARPKTSALTRRRESLRFSSLLNANEARKQFRRVVNQSRVILDWISSLENTKESDNTKQSRDSDEKSWRELASDASNKDLDFDLHYFKARREMGISKDVQTTLSLPPRSRTEEQIDQAVFGLRHLESFAEYPEHLQRMLCTVGWFQSVSPGRIIIRQGHLAENFYFLLYGRAIVRIEEQDAVTGKRQMRTASVLRKGSSFGELALLHHSRRTATVISDDAVQLLSIGRGDFFSIIAGQNMSGGTPEHIKFISTLEFMKNWPVEKLIQSPENCLLHYFKRKTTIVSDSNQSQWIYIVKSGSCQVLKFLKPAVKQKKCEAEYLKYNPQLRAASAFAEMSLTTLSSGYHQGRNSTSALSQKCSVRRYVSRSDSSQRLPALVQVEVLKRGDVFGLRTMNFEQEYETKRSTSVILASNGAECVMVYKKFFMDNADPVVRNMIRHHVCPYPTESVLQDNYQTAVDWRQYKRHLLQRLRTRTSA